MIRRNAVVDLFSATDCDVCENRGVQRKIRETNACGSLRPFNGKLEPQKLERRDSTAASLQSRLMKQARVTISKKVYQPYS